MFACVHYFFPIFDWLCSFFEMILTAFFCFKLFVFTAFNLICFQWVGYGLCMGFIIFISLIVSHVYLRSLLFSNFRLSMLNFFRLTKQDFTIKNVSFRAYLTINIFK